MSVGLESISEFNKLLIIKFSFVNLFILNPRLKSIITSPFLFFSLDSFIPGMIGVEFE